MNNCSEDFAKSTKNTCHALEFWESSRPKSTNKPGQKTEINDKNSAVKKFLHFEGPVITFSEVILRNSVQQKSEEFGTMTVNIAEAKRKCRKWYLIVALTLFMESF